MRTEVFAALILSTIFPLVLFGAPPVTGSQTTKIEAKVSAVPWHANKLPHKLIYPGDLFYPEALAKEGVQGQAVLEVILSKDGKASAAKTIGSSGSAKLDRYALDYVNTGYYTLPDKGLKYFEGVYSLNLIFQRDSILTINAKTCADFNTDVRYFRMARAGDAIENLGAFELIAGVLLFS